MQTPSLSLLFALKSASSDVKCSADTDVAGTWHPWAFVPQSWSSPLINDPIASSLYGFLKAVRFKDPLRDEELRPSNAVCRQAVRWTFCVQTGVWFKAERVVFCLTSRRHLLHIYKEDKSRHLCVSGFFFFDFVKTWKTNPMAFFSLLIQLIRRLCRPWAFF